MAAKKPWIRPKGKREERKPLMNAILVIAILYAVYLLVKSIAWVVLVAAAIVVLYMLWKRMPDAKN